jgi:hypothetical protein
MFYSALCCLAGELSPLRDRVTVEGDPLWRDEDPVHSTVGAYMEMAAVLASEMVDDAGFTVSSTCSLTNVLKERGWRLS